MKKIVRILVVAIIVMAASSSMSFAQMSKLQKSQVDLLDKNIAKAKIDIARIDNQLVGLSDHSAEVKKLQAGVDSINKTAPQTEYGKNLKRQALKVKNAELTQAQNLQSEYVAKNQIGTRNQLLANIKDWESQKKRITDSFTATISPYSATTGLPEQMTRRTARQYGNSGNVANSRLDLQIKSDQAELSIIKMANTSTIADSINGYRGVLWNTSVREILDFQVFSIDPNGKLNRIDQTGGFLRPNQKVVAYLLPGNYICKVYCKGVNFYNHNFSVSPRTYWALDSWEHWGVHAEARTYGNYSY